MCLPRQQSVGIRPEKALVEYSAAKDVDIIVVGAETNASLLDLWGGSLVERLASSTCCPVLIAQCSAKKQSI